MMDELINAPAAAVIVVTVGVILICSGHGPKSMGEAKRRWYSLVVKHVDSEARVPRSECWPLGYSVHH